MPDPATSPASPSPSLLAWPEAADVVIERGRVRAWSNSALAMYQDCGERFRRRYVLNERTSPTLRQMRGSVIHTAARTTLKRKLDTQTLPTSEETRDLAAAQFDSLWRSGVTLSAEEAAEGTKIVAAQSKDFALDLAVFHVETIAPTIHPVSIERRIIIRPKDTAIQLNATIDLIDSQARGEGIRDLKTTEKSPHGDAAHVSQQLTMYTLSRFVEVGVLPAWLMLDFMVRTPKRAEKKHVPLETTRTTEDLKRLVARINVAAEAVNKGVFVPADPSSWRCSLNWCEYFTSCPYVNGMRRPS